MLPCHLLNSLNFIKESCRDDDYENILHVLDHLSGYPQLFYQVTLSLGEENEPILEWNSRFVSCDSYFGEIAFLWVKPSLYKDKIKETEDELELVDELPNNSCLEIEDRLQRLLIIPDFG